jgi:hypothetical protein
MGVDLDESLYGLDSTTMDLGLALFPWARFRRRKAAVKSTSKSNPIYPKRDARVEVQA